MSNANKDFTRLCANIVFQSTITQGNGNHMKKYKKKCMCK
ncbi:hypothetical protein KC19_3G028000 [Ceratodon purpureus]|uniref:Uncharacterized protein n=1 Tax=Ceratodon purpureus TaxID=3225 RepID=A0A8T0IGJ4_CERPU|nr:hypothetical protein KC19_3G028000 [Ceratodon purpureus]